MDPMSGFDIRLVLTFSPRDNTLQYKDAYTSEITFLALEYLDLIPGLTTVTRHILEIVRNTLSYGDIIPVPP